MQPKHEDPYHSKEFPAPTSAGGAATATGSGGAATTVVPGPAPSTPPASTAAASTASTATERAPVAETSDSVIPAVATPGTSTPGPVAASLPPAAVETQTYSVRRNDTFSSIGKRNGVSVNALLRANPTVDPKRLQIGMSINIPGSAAAPRAAAPRTAPASVSSGASGFTTYEVQPGDNLTVIARKHGTDVKKIQAANNMRNDRIKIGDKLKIPSR